MLASEWAFSRNMWGACGAEEGTLEVVSLFQGLTILDVVINFNTFHIISWHFMTYFMTFQCDVVILRLIFRSLKLFRVAAAFCTLAHAVYQTFNPQERDRAASVVAGYEAIGLWLRLRIIILIILSQISTQISHQTHRESHSLSISVGIIWRPQLLCLG